MEKYKNDFQGFVHILNDNSIYTVFSDWMNACNFNNKFTIYNNYTAKLIKENARIGMKFVLNFTIDYPLKDIDINYVMDTVKDVIPYETIEAEVVRKNCEKEFPWYQKWDKFKYENTIEFFIPFNL